MSNSIVEEAPAQYGKSVAAIPGEQRVILRGVSWETFKALLRDLGDRRNCRLAYDEGILEIMSPYYKHESYIHYFVHLLAALAREFKYDIKGAGSMTCTREDLEKGLEPDTSFYLQSAARIRGKMELDLSVDPPPDLMIEIDISTSSTIKLPICAALKVPEVWRFNGTSFEIRILKYKNYELSNQSLAFPGLSLSEAVPRFLQYGIDNNALSMEDEFRVWIRGQLAAKKI